MLKNIFKKLNEKRGYTIIETMIAITLFLVVVVSGTGAILNANLLSQKSRSMRSILDNLSFIMDDMSKNLRTGYNYQCFDSTQSLLPSTLGAPRSCASGWALAFEEAEGNPASYADQWVYYVSGAGKLYKSTDGASTFVQLSADEIVIDSISPFVVAGAEPPPGDTLQPFVTIRLVGHITIKNTTTPFSIQTSVSQRLIDV